MDIPWLEIASLSAAALSAVATAGAWLAARRSATTANTMARIEQDRWHQELTPQFQFILGEPNASTVRLTVHLAGPDALGSLDEVRLSVVDDDMSHTITSPDDRVSQADADAHVWGPLRFTPHVDRADENGRTTGAFPLTVGRGRPLQLERTRPGHWMTGTTPDQWQEQYRAHPVRLSVWCCRGEDEWTLAYHLDNPPL